MFRKLQNYLLKATNKSKQEYGGLIICLNLLNKDLKYGKYK